MNGCARAMGAGSSLRRVSTRPARLALPFVITLIFGGVKRGGPRRLQYGAFPVRLRYLPQRAVHDLRMVARWCSLRPVGDEALLEQLLDLRLQACRKPLGLGVHREVEPFPRRVPPVRQHLIVHRQQNLKTCGLAVVGGESRPLPEQRKPSLKG